MIRPDLSLSARLRTARSVADLGEAELNELAADAIERGGWTPQSTGLDAATITLLGKADVLGISLDWLLLNKGPVPDGKEIREAVAAARHRVTRASIEAPAAEGDAASPEAALDSILAEARTSLHNALEALDARALVSAYGCASHAVVMLGRACEPGAHPEPIEAEARALYEVYRLAKPVAVNSDLVPTWEENPREDVKDAWRATAHGALLRAVARRRA